ncbi:MAG TPA: AAA family ATPase, partial [Candidatus Sulfomarinibacteraceae bacterium]|nr:AAA family ATPase [Candidatus Sulfomarinibacteraceae bacterium]
MSCLHLAFLGAPQVHHGPHPLSFRTQKALALLIYLAVEGEVHTREKLATLFWPDSDASAARANLRSTLMYLRKALAHEPSPQPEQGEEHAQHLLVQRHTLGFNGEVAHTLDLNIVTNAIAADDKAAMEDALSVVRGEFLEGFSLPDAPEFDNWASIQREATHLQLNDLYDRLTHRQLQGGQPTLAQQTARRWLGLSALEERAYRCLMRAQAIVGDRVGALKTYEECRQQLRQELNVAPAPETSALAERIKRESLESNEPITVRSGPEEEYFSVESLPLVGRTEEHETLVKAFAQARRNHLQLVTLEGEAGIGKTRLARAFLAWAQSEEATILKARAYETGGGRLPYQPIVDLWRLHLETENTGQYSAAALDQLSESTLADLSILFPSLQERDSQPTHPHGPEQTSANRLFEAVAQLGTVMSQDQPLILFIDDLQWADVASLDLLHYVARRWQEMEIPVMLLVTIRNEALVSRSTAEASTDLHQWLQSVRRDVPLARLTLSTLSNETVRRLLEAVVDEGDARSLASWLYQETAGQPFYLVETLNSLMEMDAIRASQTPDGDWRLQIKSVPDKQRHHSFVPPGVRTLIRERLSRLSPPAFDLLAAASVLGQAFTFRHLYYVADLEPAGSIKAMDELLAAKFLRDSENPSSYHFGHDKIRDVVYTEAGDARRYIFHRRAFYLLEAENAPAARVAHHAQRADEVQAAFENYLQAGSEAMTLFATRDAAHFYEQAHQIMVETETIEVTPESRRRLYERLARARELLNHWPEAEAVYHEMLAFARDNALPEWIATALNRLALVHILGHWQPTKAIALLEEARQIDSGRASLIETEFILSQIRQYDFEQAAAISHAQRAVTLAREEGDEKLLARSL